MGADAAAGNDVREAVNLFHRLFLFLDERRYEALAALFAPEGSWHRQGRLLRGRAAIVAALNERSSTLRICHVVTNAFAEAAGADAAEAHCVMTAYRHDDGPGDEAPAEVPPTIAGPAVMARVRARMRRLPEGWHIESMTMDYLFHFAAPAAA